MEVPLQRSDPTISPKALNQAMSKLGVTVEWIFDELKLYCTTLKFKREMSVAKASVGAIIFAAMILTNTRNCVYPKTVSRYLDYVSPLLSEYPRL